MLHVRFVDVDKTSTDLQILDCELHQNAFGGDLTKTYTGRIYG